MFSQFGIPVSETRIDYRVRSGRFGPMEVWGGVVFNRVRCGPDTTDDPRAGPTPNELEITARIRSTPQGGTRVNFDSHGHGKTAEGDEVRCRVTEEFEETLPAGIPEAGGQGPGWIGL